MIAADRPLRVLVIDDDIALGKSTAAFLRNYRFHVEVAYGVTAALQSVWRLPPDILLIDLAMPEVDGAQLASTLMHLSGMDETRVIFMREGTAAWAHALPAHDAMLTKPFEPEHMLDTIAATVESLRKF